MVGPPSGRMAAWNIGAAKKPPVPEGYAATIDPHVLKPVWPSCARRLLKVQMQMDTGLLEIDGVCCNPASGKTGRHLLTLADCQQCSVRRAIITG